MKALEDSARQSAQSTYPSQNHADEHILKVSFRCFTSFQRHNFFMRAFIVLALVSDLIIGSICLKSPQSMTGIPPIVSLVDFMSFLIPRLLSKVNRVSVTSGKSDVTRHPNR